jgi:uncharacterized OB-fold protein
MTNQPFTHATFLAFLAEGKLMGSRSRATGKVYVPPRPLCPETFSDDMEWVQLSGKGRLAAHTTIYYGPTAMIRAGCDARNPYCAGIVRLEEGPAISAQILGVDVTDPAAIAIGTPLQATFVDRGEGEERQTVLAFEPT